MQISLYQKVPETYFASQFDVNDWDSWSKYISWLETYDGYYVLRIAKRIEEGDWVLFKDDGRDIPVDVMSNKEFERSYQKVNREKETNVY